MSFDHEKLTVYQRSIEFVEVTSDLFDRLPKSSSVRNQMERASTSIPLNIAEGNGKWTPRDRCRFFDIACGSALECAAALDIAVARGFLEKAEVERGNALLAEIVRMTIGLIKANDPERNFGSSRLREE